MAQYRTRNRTFLAKVETTAGTDAVPVVGTDAILVENPQPSPNFETFDTNEVTGSLDGRGPIVGGGNFGMTCLVYMKGAGTAGAAPDFAPLLKAAAMVEELVAAPVTGTAAAGSASSITLETADAATDDYYTGLVIELTGGTGSGQHRVVTNYVASTKVATVYPNWTTPADATSIYAFPSAAIYRPGSSDLDNVTCYLYDHASDGVSDSMLRKMVGAAATFTAEFATRAPGKLNFTLTGQLGELPAGVSHPGDATYTSVRPRPLLDADAELTGTGVAFRALTLDYGAQVQQSDDPSALYGYGLAGVTSRKIKGTLNPLLDPDTRDNLGDLLSGTGRMLWVRYGSAAGNRVSILIPSCVFTQVAPTDLDGFNAEQITFESVGIDTGLFLSFY